mmetsp:Transcript_12089/g.20391  ORF Transcript_12089/g.20391 Transcript_12089/m.20391 type:complete len:142 (+) Transcript_12089:1014-1439(+)
MKSYYFSRVIVRFFQSATKQFDGDGDDQAIIVDYFLREEQHLLNQYNLLNENADEDNTHLMDAIAKRRERIEQEAESIRRSVQENNHKTSVERFENFFDDQLRQLMQHLSEQVKIDKHIAHLVMRLDYNEFYSRQFEEEYN